ncbi:MAG: ATP-binding cassette domain-containing protein [Actinomycetota bacterium]|jgi:ATPase subunit of ABC transporter with duplicated ATPase domains|nr:ABC-F family ATP-binding cassette domain-containing protein [Euzebyaceae bacterium]MDQ3451300.1 ATP-binding cassette domain-containing protein [Actinomycetota bacterium]
MLTFSGVSKSFDARPALVDVTLSVAAGSRTAVVGVNGSGKTTLLRLAAGELDPDRGNVSLPTGATVAYVPQDYGIVAAATVEQYLKLRAGVLGIEHELHALEGAVAAGDEVAAAAYADALDRYAAVGGYEIDGRVQRALAALQLPAATLPRPLGELSGGQQVRVGLAGILASRFDLYLLDEPTNNLDLIALELLTDFVATADATFLLVSHDRAFLDETANSIIEIDEHSHTAEAFGVSFAEYRQTRARLLATQSARYRAYLDEVARLQGSIRTKRTSAARRTDNRPPRDGDKMQRDFLTERAATGAGKSVRALERRLQRLEAVAEPRTGWELRLSLAATSRSGDLVVEADNVVKTYGPFRLGPLALAVHWRDRLALLGHNGAGKSVLIGLLTGAVKPDSGTVRRGPGVRVGVLQQGGADLAGRGSGLATFLAAVPTTEADARTLLAKFDLGADHVLRGVYSYSPGERCRLGLAILMAKGANWLVLDEPTNHLDLEAQEELEQALTGFDGTLLMVSHDREFLERIGITRRVELADGQLLNDVPA